MFGNNVSCAPSPKPSTPVPTGGKAVHYVYGEYLAAAYPWQWFVTMTSKKRTHPEALFKTFRFCLSMMSRQYQNRRPKVADKVVWVAALERHKSGNPHLHALMWHRDDLNAWSPTSRKEFRAALEAYSGWSRVEMPNKNASVTRYCAKYLAKDGEIQFSPTFGVHGSIEI